MWYPQMSFAMLDSRGSPDIHRQFRFPDWGATGAFGGQGIELWAIWGDDLDWGVATAWVWWLNRPSGDTGHLNIGQTMTKPYLATWYLFEGDSWILWGCAVYLQGKQETGSCGDWPKKQQPFPNDPFEVEGDNADPQFEVSLGLPVYQVKIFHWFDWSNQPQGSTVKGDGQHAHHIVPLETPWTPKMRCPANGHCFPLLTMSFG